MNVLSRNFLILTTLSCLSTAVLARGEYRRDPRHDGMRDRFRRDMNICSEIKEDFEQAQDKYEEYGSRLEEFNRNSSMLSSQIKERDVLLKRAQENLTKAIRRSENLERKKDRVPMLIKKLSAERTGIERKQLPVAVEEKERKEKREREKCKTLLDRISPNCFEAKNDRDKARERVHNLQVRIGEIDTEIDDLKNINQRISIASRNQAQAQREFDLEKNRTPSLASLQRQQRELENQRSTSFRGIERVEEAMVHAEIKLEKCERMSFDAYVYSALKEHVELFRRNGCSDINVLVSNARSAAKKQGIQEAYDVVCKYSRSPTTSPTSPDYRGDVRTVPYHYATPNPYRDDMDETITLEASGAREIKLDLNGFDIESGFDFLHVYDQYGNKVVSFTNDTKFPVEEIRTTGWVQGDRLELRFVSDGRTTGAGFQIDGFQVRY